MTTPLPLPLVIAEIGTAHQGDISRARDLVHAARDAGADLAKFQLVRAREILHPQAGSVDLPGGSIALYDRFRELERPLEFYQQLRDLCSDAGIAFLCTPFGLESARVLRNLAVDTMKIASPELNYHQLLREVAGYGIPLVLSTGVATTGDIAESLELIHATGCRTVTLLHCVTAYPAPEEEYNLRVIPGLRQLFGVPVGLSDHSMDPLLVPSLATTLGATVIEKHITLDRRSNGLDDPIALEPGDFSMMVREVRRISAALQEATGDPVEYPRRRVELQGEIRRTFGDARVDTVLGDGVKRLAASEARNYGYTNRSIHAMEDLPAGAVLTRENCAVLRTERNLTPGLHPRYWERILGYRTTAPATAGAGITWNHLLTAPAGE